MNHALLLAIAMASAACSSSTAAGPILQYGEVVDLSHPYDAQTIYWPTSDRFRLDKLSDGITDNGYYYAANNIFTAEHGGTHIDAPVHFAKGGRTVDQIPLAQLIGEAVVVDVVLASNENRDYRITVDDLIRWEREHEAIPAGAIVLFRTGFARHWPDAARYLGTAERGDAGVAALHFPGLHPEAARWLIARAPKAVGIDTASIDYGQSKLHESHRALFERGIPAFENLAALDRLPARGASVIALPMKIGGGSGGPLRVAALLPRAAQ